MKQWIQAHPLTAYFLSAFIWSWVWWCSLIFTTPHDAILTGQLPSIFFFFAFMGGFGPSLAGLLVAGVTGGRRRIHAMLSFKRGLQAKWLLAAILIVLLITLAQAGVQALTGRAVFYNIVPLMLVMGFVWPLFSSFGEEIGWRGFALPRLLEKTSAARAALLLGVIWGLWHLPADYIAYAAYGWLFVPMFLLVGILTLTAHSVIMTYLYRKTGGSLLTMIVYHYMVTATAILAPSVAFFGLPDNIAKTAVSVAVLCVPAIVLLLRRRGFS